MPSAEIVAIGTEILLGDIVDTNSQALGKLLAEHGIDHKRRITVGDHLERAAAVIREALARCDIVFTIGGLGPTGDDLTRDAISLAVGEGLIVDEAALQTLKSYVKARGGMWRAAYIRQAMRPSSAVCLPNDAGTAPGIHWQRDGKHVIAMPGPSNEFLGMLSTSVAGILASLSVGTIYSRTIRILGIPESALGEMFSAEMESENPTVSPYAKVGDVHLRVTAKSANRSDAAKIVDPVVQSIYQRLGEAVYSVDDEDLASVVIRRMADRGESLAVAESCTGGMLGARITSIPGASSVFAGGIVAYSDMAKVDGLHVVAEDLEKFGAVSAEIARQMATNVRGKLGSTRGLAITGVAGPGGGTEKKPVGLVYVAVSGPDNTRVEECRFRGSRDHIRELSVLRALAELWQEIK